MQATTSTEQVLFHATLEQLRELLDTPEKLLTIGLEELVPAARELRRAHASRSKRVVSPRSSSRHPAGPMRREVRALTHDLPDALDYLERLRTRSMALEQVQGFEELVHARWVTLDDVPQRDYLHVLVAAMREAQDGWGAADRGEHRPRIAALFRHLKEHVTAPRRLFVHGMALDNEPAHGSSWGDDITHYTHALISCFCTADLGPRSNPKKQASPRPDTRSQDAAPSRSLDLLAGKRVVVLGGNPDPNTEMKLERAGRPDSLTWIDARNMRKVQSLSSRIKRGSVDVIIVLTRFISHKATKRIESAKRSRDVRVVMVHDSAGFDAICRSVAA